MKISLRTQIAKHLFEFLFGNKDFQIELGHLKYIVQPRSDAFIILWETYVAELYTPSFELNTCKTIVDVGAYTGDFTLWANDKFFPNRIIAIEPNTNLYTLLEQNVIINNMSENTICENKALLEDTEGMLITGILQSKTRVIPADKVGGIAKLTLAELIEKYNIEVIDYFKMDIEGGEKFVLVENNKDIFKNNVSYVSMETHNIDGFNRINCIRFFKDLDFDIKERKLFNGNTQLEAKNKFL